MIASEWTTRIITSMSIVATIILFNLSVLEKEELLANGRPFLFELAPRDPRSLMQGDYMVLRYRLAEEMETRPSNSLDQRGFLALQVEGNLVADGRFLSAATDIAADEVLIEYKRVDDEIKIGPESFFFQEGDADLYAEARYGELRIDEKGQTLLVGLRGKDQSPLRN